MFVGNESIAGFDDELNDAIKKEIIRQEEHVELIASENIVSNIDDLKTNLNSTTFDSPNGIFLDENQSRDIKYKLEGLK